MSKTVPPIPERSSTFHLLVESAVASSDKTSTAGKTSIAGATVLAIPEGISFLSIDANLEPRLTTTRSEPALNSLVLEPTVLRDGQPRLLMMLPASCAVRVNENRAPQMVVLRERDQFQFDDSPVFHVALFHRPQTGPAPTHCVGKPCPICLTPFSDDPASICYRCPCGTLLHLQDSAGLECARAVRECPHCHQLISLEEGYGWLPNLES
jgi:hypothetical protein